MKANNEGVVDVSGKLSSIANEVKQKPNTFNICSVMQGFLYFSPTASDFTYAAKNDKLYWKYKGYDGELIRRSKLGKKDENKRILRESKLYKRKY